MSCTWHRDGGVELYFYGELDEASRARFAAHLDACETCRAALADLQVIRQVLAARRLEVDPPHGDWDPFMRRLDAHLGEEAARSRTPRPWSAGWLLKVAAVIGIAVAGALGGFRWQRWHTERATPVATTAPARTPVAARDVQRADALTAVANQHLERSKLVLLGLAIKDPRKTPVGGWQYERRLASTLLPDTTQYRLAASEQGRADLADVLGDLETVLLQTSLGDDSDPAALARLQRLIDRRDLLTKIDVLHVEGSEQRAIAVGAVRR